MESELGLRSRTLFTGGAFPNHIIKGGGNQELGCTQVFILLWTKYFSLGEVSLVNTKTHLFGLPAQLLFKSFSITLFKLVRVKLTTCQLLDLIHREVGYDRKPFTCNTCDDKVKVRRRLNGRMIFFFREMARRYFLASFILTSCLGECDLIC